MTNESYYTLFEEIIEDLQGGGKDSLTKTISTLMNVAMKIEQEKALQASPYERNEERTGQRNGYKDKTLKTRVGEIPVQIPQVRGMEFYPGAIDKGDRSERALKLAIAQMYIQGVSTRRVSKIVEVLCGFEVSQAQVSDAAKLLDVEIEKWRNRPLGAFRYLVLDATYEKVRLEQAVVSGAVLIAYGVDNNGKRRVLGISTEISEAEVHWRAFLKSLVVGVMQKPVEGGCCYRIISHDFSPFSKDFVAGQNDRSMLVARIYELEEQGRLFTCQVFIAHLINEQHMRLAEPGKLVFQPALVPGALQAFEKIQAADEVRCVTVHAGLLPQGGHQVGFSQTARAQQDDVFLAFDEGQR
jgi:hypothetical protein